MLCFAGISTGYQLYPTVTALLPARLAGVAESRAGSKMSRQQREQSTDWGQKMNSCPSGKASAQVFGGILHFQLLRIRQLMKRCHGRTKRCKWFCARFGQDKVQRELDGAETVSRVWELTAATARDSKHQQSSEWRGQEARHGNCGQTITALRLILPLFMG